jgi:hypothetical protein
VELVNDLPPESQPEYAEIVTIFEGDADCAAVARTRVEAAGIDSWTKDEGVHGIFPSLGGTSVEVRIEDEENALNALASTEDQENGTPHKDLWTSRRSLEGAAFDKGFQPGAWGSDVSNTRKQDHEASNTSFQPEDHRRSGKRV